MLALRGRTALARCGRPLVVGRRRATRTPRAALSTFSPLRGPVAQEAPDPNYDPESVPLGPDTGARIPLSIQANYYQPLRRKATHGIPVCDLQLRSFSARNLEFMCDFALRAAYYAQLPAFGPVPLPRRRELWTVPRSNFVHKKSQENFERVTLKRLIQIRDGHPETVELWLAFLRQHQFYGVGLKANVYGWEELGVGKRMNSVSLSALHDVPQQKWLHFGPRKNVSTAERALEILNQPEYKALANDHNDHNDHNDSAAKQSSDTDAETSREAEAAVHESAPLEQEAVQADATKDADAQAAAQEPPQPAEQPATETEPEDQRRNVLEQEEAAQVDLKDDEGAARHVDEAQAAKEDVAAASEAADQHRNVLEQEEAVQVDAEAAREGEAAEEISAAKEAVLEQEEAVRVDSEAAREAETVEEIGAAKDAVLEQEEAVQVDSEAAKEAEAAEEIRAANDAVLEQEEAVRIDSSETAKDADATAAETTSRTTTTTTTVDAVRELEQAVQAAAENAVHLGAAKNRLLETYARQEPARLEDGWNSGNADVETPAGEKKPES